MKNYYVRFNGETEKVDIYWRADDSLIQSVEVTDGIVSVTDLDKAADAMPTEICCPRDFSDLEYDIFYEDRRAREDEKEWEAEREAERQAEWEAEIMKEEQCTC